MPRKSEKSDDDLLVTARKEFERFNPGVLFSVAEVYFSHGSQSGPASTGN